MDPRLLQAYNEELIYLRETAREFGEEYETVAGRLGLNAPGEIDPYVERLLEGVAFLNARVQLKLQDQFPNFTQHLLNAVQPQYLAPTPSMCVVGFEPQDGDPGLTTGYPVPRLTELAANSSADTTTPVTFRTGQAVTLWPLKITEAEYLPTRAATAPYSAAAGVRAEAGLRLRLATTGGAPLDKIDPTTLPIYLDGSEVIPGELYRQLVGDAVATVARSPAVGGGWTRLPAPEAHGFEDACALLPQDRRAFRGYRLLTEYFACPERFLFVRLNGLGRAFACCEDSCDVVVLFNRAAAALAGALSPANFRLYAAPAINLFEKQIDRVALSPYEQELQLIPDRTRPLDFEIYRVLEVTGFAESNSDPRPVAPLYSLGSLLHDWGEALFYLTQLRPRRLSTKEQRLRRRTDYVGTETWLSLTAPGAPERVDERHELAVRALVTNRELAASLKLGGKTDLLAAGLPVRAVSVLRAPTKPRPPLGLTDTAWRVIGHLTPNYASFLSEEDDDPAVLRNHLALYGQIDDPALRRQIDGILSVSGEPVTRRVPGRGRTAFARGTRVRIRLDDASFESARMFLFAAVLDRFLGEFATVNAFSECAFESPHEGLFMQWPPRMGRRRNI
jgi:type VI secretion system protein ImpG